jgi:hypothetical protein
MTRPLAAAALLIVLVASLTGCSLRSSNTSYDGGSDSDTSYEAPPAPDIPAGYSDAGNGIATKFVDGRPCSYGVCSWVEVYAYADCPNSVYIEANIFNADEVVIDYTNGTLAQLLTGQTGLIELNTLTDGAAQVKLTEIDCY